MGAPYPVFLAIGGALLAFVPGAPSFTLPPELVLALFVAPILVDAGYDASLRDLRDNWAPLVSLVDFRGGPHDGRCGRRGTRWCRACRGLQRSRSAPSSRRPMRWRPPRCCARCARRSASSAILEGESLLNDASALLIYRLAVGAGGGRRFLRAGGGTRISAGGAGQPDCRAPLWLG